jgi:murein DD-endopeptidase MepM/ murein hydrolase activator NlpD
LILLLLLFAPPFFGAGATQDEIRKKQAELQSLRSQIREFEDRIGQQQKNERETLELLDSYDRKGTALRRLIGKLRSEEKDLQRSIETTRAELRRLEDQLKFLREHYARYVSSAYKSGRLHDLELLLSSASVNQIYVRAEYLRRFTEQRRRDAEKISAKRSQVEETQAKLQTQLGEERRLIAEKAAEEDRLASLAADRKDVLQRIRKDRRQLQREFDRKTKAARQLEDLITNLIAQEQARKEAQAKGRLPQPPPAGGGVEARKGRLRWPVPEGSIVARFGNQRHPTLKTITQNTGIDIAVPAGSPVSAVAEGEVTTIWWLPGYGNLIIVDHGAGYRTVYAHLSEIGVSEGQRVKEGDLLGASGESLEGPRLHFEIWKDRDKQNPELWLSRP